jgi:ketosteroid isomerase-like protein
MRPKFELKLNNVFQAGDDIALIFSDWTLAATDSDGNPVEMAAQTSDVARRRPDRSWLLVIDNLWGSEHSVV